MLAVSFASFSEPAIAARWRDLDLARAGELAARWRDRPALRFDDVLEPGIAAEIVAWIPRMPLGPTVDRAGHAVWWSCDAELPSRPDPRLPGCFVRLVRFFDVDLPTLAGSITGRRLVPARPHHFSVRVWRKGSFADGPAETPPGSIEAIVGLTAGDWPDAWGGVLEVLDQRLSPGWNTLDLVGGSPPQQVTLLTHHVEMVTLCTTLVEAAP